MHYRTLHFFLPLQQETHTAICNAIQLTWSNQKDESRNRQTELSSEIKRLRAELRQEKKDKRLFQETVSLY